MRSALATAHGAPPRRSSFHVPRTTVRSSRTRVVDAAAPAATRTILAPHSVRHCRAVRSLACVSPSLTSTMRRGQGNIALRGADVHSHAILCIKYPIAYPISANDQPVTHPPGLRPNGLRSPHMP